MSKVYKAEDVIVTIGGIEVEGYYQVPETKLTKEENFKLGQQLCLEGLSYTQIAKKLGTVDAAVFRGFDDINRVTRCLYSQRHWNMSGGIKTTMDIRTLF